MNSLIAFIVLSIPVVLISRRSLFNLRKHGFYRFISWECIVWLLVHNVSYWFNDPFSFMQILSWICLIYSLVLILAGILMFKRTGKQNSSRNDDVLYHFEKTTMLIKTGIYKYVRHPLYGSLLFLTWGIFFKHYELHLLIVSLISTIFLFLTATIEERNNIGYFGEEYHEYMKETKMFVPFIF